METTNTADRTYASQQLLFQQIRDKLPPHISLVDEMEDLLEISQDSAYRRIRGEKELSFGEMQKLVSSGAFTIEHEGQEVRDEEKIDTMLREAIQPSLNRIMQNALLVG